MFTVVDLFPSAIASQATGINSDGMVCGIAAGKQAFAWIPGQPNSASGTRFDLLPLPGLVEAQALGINKMGNVVGSTGGLLPVGNVQRATMWSNINAGGGSIPFDLPIRFSPLGLLPGNSGANAINDNLVIAGWHDLSLGSTRRAFVWDLSMGLFTMRDLDPLDPNLPSEAMAINNQGIVAGWAQALDPGGSPVSHALIWSAATGQILNDFGTFASVIPVNITDLHAQALGINDQGVIVGVGDLTNAPVRARAGFIISVNGTMQMIPTIPSPNTCAWSIAPNGTTAMTMAILDQNGQIIDHGGTFNQLQGVFDIDSDPSPWGGHGLSGGWVMTEARAVNDFGEICGQGSQVMGSMNHALLLVP